jgi:hypothetical protein
MHISGRLELCFWLIERQGWLKLHIRIALFWEDVYILYVLKIIWDLRFVLLVARF